MKIDAPTGNKDAHDAQYKVRFEPRKVGDLKYNVPEQAFANVERVSKVNEAFYSTFVSPWVRLMTTPTSAEMLRMTHPMRASRLMFSESYNPWMRFIRQTASSIAETRVPLTPDNSMIQRERTAISAVGDAVERARITRDATYERLFETIYGTKELDPNSDPRMPV